MQLLSNLDLKNINLRFNLNLDDKVMKYPVNIVNDGETLFVSFPDILEALTCGDDLEDALDMAFDALLTTLDFYFEDERSIPLPSSKPSKYYVELPDSVTQKILSLNSKVNSSY